MCVCVRVKSASKGSGRRRKRRRSTQRKQTRTSMPRKQTWKRYFLTAECSAFLPRSLERARFCHGRPTPFFRDLLLRLTITCLNCFVWAGAQPHSLRPTVLQRLIKHASVSYSDAPRDLDELDQVCFLPPLLSTRTGEVQLVGSSQTYVPTSSFFFFYPRGLFLYLSFVWSLVGSLRARKIPRLLGITRQAV